MNQQSLQRKLLVLEQKLKGAEQEVIEGFLVGIPNIEDGIENASKVAESVRVSQGAIHKTQ